MNIYIDESGSINNREEKQKFFVIALVRVIDRKRVVKAYKRFVTSNLNELKRLDKDKKTSGGTILRKGGKMFKQGAFAELKGAQLDRAMKKKFINRFLNVSGYEVYYIVLNNNKLTNDFCDDKSAVFNYSLKIALEYFMNHNYLPQEHCNLQLDERNEKTDRKHFLEQYLNTEFAAKGFSSNIFNVEYFDSSQNTLVQVADVFANFYYSHLMTGKYSKELNELKKKKIIKHIFIFPL